MDIRRRLNLEKEKQDSKQRLAKSEPTLQTTKEVSTRDRLTQSEPNLTSLTLTGKPERMMHKNTLVKATATSGIVGLSSFAAAASLPISLGAGLFAGVAFYAKKRMEQRAKLEEVSFGTTYPVIEFNNLRSPNLFNDNVSDIKDDACYYIGGATKTGFADWTEKSPLKHASIALVPKDIYEKVRDMDPAERDEYAEKNQFCLIIGRQSPAFQKKIVEQTPVKTVEEQIKEGAANINTQKTSSKWSTLKSRLHGLTETAKTQIDNENHYELFPNVPFKAQMSIAKFSGKEIKEIINETDEKICNATTQPCTFVRSNCCSGAIYMLAKAVEIIHNRPITTSYTKEMADAEISSLSSLMLAMTRNNMSEGVINNTTVTDKVENAIKICNERNLVAKAGKAYTV